MLRSAIVVAFAAASVGMLAGPASAATSPDTTVANVAVQTAISMTGLTENFTLTGVPGATVTAGGAVTMNVKTNNLLGYSVTVQSDRDEMTPVSVSTPANLDTIPIGALSVREGTSGLYTPMSDSSSFTAHTQAVRSAELGDTVSNEYQVIIPFVNQDTYTATLNYVATTL